MILGASNAAPPIQDMYRDFMTRSWPAHFMPSFADTLKPEEAWSLVFYLRTLQPDNTQEKMIAKQLGLTPIDPNVPLPASAPAPASAQPTTTNTGAEGTAPSNAPTSAPPAGNSTNQAAPANPPAATSLLRTTKRLRRATQKVSLSLQAILRLPRPSNRRPAIRQLRHRRPTTRECNEGSCDKENTR